MGNFGEFPPKAEDGDRRPEVALAAPRPEADCRTRARLRARRDFDRHGKGRA